MGNWKSCKSLHLRSLSLKDPGASLAASRVMLAYLIVCRDGHSGERGFRLSLALPPRHASIASESWLLLLCHGRNVTLQIRVKIGRGFLRVDVDHPRAATSNPTLFTSLLTMHDWQACMLCIALKLQYADLVVLIACYSEVSWGKYIVGKFTVSAEVEGKNSVTT